MEGGLGDGTDIWESENRNKAYLRRGFIMSEQEEKLIQVRVSSDGLAAYVKVSPNKGQMITYEDIKAELEANQVVYGIDEEIIREIINEKRYFIEVQVASGEEPEDGKDGYYEYLFDVDVDLKPKILKDGSVDYKSMGEVPVVQENQELVRYHRSTSPINGMNVRGEEIVGKKGKDLMVLKGKGFLLSEDKTLYRAALIGKAVAKNGSLVVTNVLEIDGDVSISTGGVNFAGDVIIRGNVLAGTEVRAHGSIEVNGCVEAATLVAGKNVLLKNGMQGNGKGSICAGKDVSGKFFEQVNIKAKGNVSANAIMNCDITCEDAISVSGRFGIIVGGRVTAMREIEATLIGNMNETKTVLEVGTREDLYTKMHHLEQECKEIIAELTKYANNLEKIERKIKENGTSKEMQEVKMNVMRSKIEKEAKLSDLEKQKEKVIEDIGKTSNARVIVLKSIYPGTRLIINGVTENIKTENYNSTYQRKGVEIGFTPNI